MSGKRTHSEQTDRQRGRERERKREYAKHKYRKETQLDKSQENNYCRQQGNQT